MSLSFLSDKYFIRKFIPSDADSLSMYANNYNVYKWLKDSFPYPYTIKDAKNWIEFSDSVPDGLHYAIANEKEAIGGIGVKFKEDVYRYSPEIGYWLGEPFWGKGIATEAVKAFVNFLFTNFDFRSLTANVFEGNPASGKVLEKAGFKLDGMTRKAVYKENKFLDLYIYSILKEELLK